MRKKIRETQPVSYWKSMVDVITTLLMVILLVLMFFVINFLINNQQEEFPDYQDYTGYHDHDGGDGDDDYDPTPTPTSTPTPTPHIEHGGGGGGDGQDDPGIYEEEGIEGEGYEKAAVYAVLIDEETGQVIEVPDVIFELHANRGSKITLTTHYPLPISYNEFETTDGGWFYLPEKIRLGDYYFHQITEVEGYDFSSDTYFEIEESYEWEKPYVVNIPLGAAKNNIQIQINDADTELGLNGVVFNVVAAETIATPDGTVRYHEREVADVIYCDSTGYGLSKDLYLGKYVLEPASLPYGYASPSLSSRSLTLPRREAPGEYAPLLILESEKTRVVVKASDELNDTILLSGVTMKLTSEDGSDSERTFTTNESGVATIQDLNKGTEYTITLEDLPNGYTALETSHKFTVDSIGLIDGEPSCVIPVAYRLIRAEVSITDRVLKDNLLGYKLELIDEDGNVVDEWISSDKPYEISGIAPGVYTLKVEDSNDEMTIRVEDTQEIQRFSASVMTRAGYIIVASIGAFILLALLVVVLIVIPKVNDKRKNKKKDKETA